MYAYSVTAFDKCPVHNNSNDNGPIIRTTLRSPGEQGHVGHGTLKNECHRATLCVCVCVNIIFLFPLSDSVSAEETYTVKSAFAFTNVKGDTSP